VHEWSIVQTLLAEVERHARARGARSVGRLHLRVGVLSGVEIELLETAWESFRERSCCAGAALEIERVPARWSCPRCEVELASGGLLRCGGCGGRAQLESGDEIVLARIEMDVVGAEEAPAATVEEGS
jgi:hydrogenase nickel incorporation protein HypA/HybF